MSGWVSLISVNEEVDLPEYDRLNTRPPALFITHTECTVIFELSAYVEV